MTALITGGGGFVGQLLTKKLRARDQRVKALVRDKNRSMHTTDSSVEFCIGDLRDRDSLTTACRNVDTVFHTAALATHWDSRAACWQTNVQGTANLLDAMTATRVRRLIHFSSYLVYGRRAGIRTEDDPCQTMNDPYVDSKIAGDELVRSTAGDRGITWTILRPTNIYGPPDPKWMPMVARNILLGRMRLFGLVDREAAIVYGDDVAEFAVACSDHPRAACQVFNVTSDEVVTWSTFLGTLAAHLGTTFPRGRIPLALARPVAGALEGIWHGVGAIHPPPLTRFGIALLSSDWRCTMRKGREVIGFAPATLHSRGLQASVTWMVNEGLLQDYGRPAPCARPPTLQHPHEEGRS